MVVKIITNKEKTTYQVVDEAFEDMPENRSKIFPTAIEAVNQWLYPNNTEDTVAKFLAEIPVVEDEPTPEPRIGEIPPGNIINMVMGKDFQRIDTYHNLVAWCCKVLGFGDHSMSTFTIAWKGRGEFAPEFLSELDSRVQKIDAISLLRLFEVADAGKRGCRGDIYNDDLAEAIQHACMNRLADFMDSLPPSLWHKVHRHQLWQENAETEAVSLPSPDGWVTISGIRPSQHGAWKVKMVVGSNTYESPQYVEKMGLKARHDDYAKGSHSGVQCQAYHLFNHDGTLWGFEVYLISPLKTVGCEVTKDGRFSLFRKGVYLPPRSSGVIRQGDMVLRKLEYDGTPTEHRHEGYDYWHPITRVHTEETVGTITVKPTTVKEWKAQPINLPSMLWSVRIHPLQNGEEMDKDEDAVVVKLSYQGYVNEESTEPVLVITQPTVLRHPDHPSIQLEAGYYQILPVEGETDYQPPQRRGD